MKLIKIEYDFINYKDKSKKSVVANCEKELLVNDAWFTGDYLKTVALDGFIKPILQNLASLYGADSAVIKNIDIIFEEVEL